MIGRQFSRRQVRQLLRVRVRSSLVMLSLIFGLAALTSAQTSPRTMPTPPEPINIDKPQSSDDKPALGTIDEEMRVKQSIKLLEKEYKQNVERAREAAELGAQLRDALKDGRPFGREETKKLERLEKLAKKIRDEAGGSDEDDLINNPPGKLDSALSRLADVAEALFKVVEKTPRQVISAAVIEKANALLQLARVTRNLFH
ncbi:MAG: hypothetical protein JWM21_1477 [Acidobacteria bacterium]|nr:hypothetical protein [Acidobacteriota bacterium]